LPVAAVDSSSPRPRSARTGTDRERPPINLSGVVSATTRNPHCFQRVRVSGHNGITSRAASLVEAFVGFGQSSVSPAFRRR
jgi:hypothetical protein